MNKQRFAHFQHAVDGANKILGQTRFVLEHQSRGYLIHDNDKGTCTECRNLDEIASSAEYEDVYFTIVNG